MVARIAFAAAAGVVALVLFLVAAWFLGDALMLLLQTAHLSPAAAAALTGVAGLVLAGLIGLTARLVMRPRRRPAAPAASSGNGIAADLGALAAQQIVGTARSHPYGTAGAALAAGLAVGAIPELRKSLVGLFKH